MAARLSRSRSWLLLATTLVLHIFLSRPPLSHQNILAKRTLESTPQTHQTLLSLPYDEWYDSTPAALKPFFIVFLLLVLTFLFSFIGISASDFFCPNLSTVATQLGLSESTAGVTFLAFGNGSPDVFSTFSALKGGTFGLAIGELIGAASFIVSIVVGSIALIRPFHVPRHAFLRDVLFFTSAVIVLIVVLADGHLTIFESGGMVMLYAAYVVVVVAGNWWSGRRRKQMQDEAVSRPPLSSPRHETSMPNLRVASPLLPPEISSSRRRPRSQTVISHSEADYSLDTPRPTFSLLGAIEFRDVVNSLKRESPSNTTTPVRTPSPYHRGSTDDYFGPVVQAYTHRRASSHGPPRRSSSQAQTGASQRSDGDNIDASGEPNVEASGEPNPWKDQRGLPHPTQPARPDLSRLVIPATGTHDFTSSPAHLGLPTFSLVDPSGAQSDLPADIPGPQESRFQLRRRGRKMLRILFPSLQSFRHKSYIGMLLAVLSVPAVLALTITLPVVDDGRGDEGGVALPEGENEGLNDGYIGDLEEGDEERLLTPDVGEGLHHLVDHGFSPLHSPLGRLHEHSQLNHHIGTEEEAMMDRMEEEQEEEALNYHRSLTAAQCLFGPLFCCLIIFNDTSYLLWVLLGAGILGGMAGTVVLMRSTDGGAQPWRFMRCICGFTCSMVWIAAIADEVVSVLGTVGEILGLSDAIIGLTIFAVGNSLADLVANVTVAQFAPAMAYAACFGGPMLNLLLGIGGSGTYHMLSSKTQKPVSVNFSPTLWVSAGGLVLILTATAVFVPLNNYLIDRRWAICLICAYLVVMGVNVGVEIRTGRG